ncbi:hypothetical protein BLA60_39865 [Actinophytocola xinjiangensis]|uniref:YdhG-like domain-containing protein n=1 Tax=Actinophytocola xinjiangensis TaxID=485602 RepID=A0A7Z1ATQ2_9PSEU|nr:DUF1801 domain-containing protein [Actinophytocola xinjiangensis]OLF04668.1 hypothetical protein BLA60_39865 [Actinophytocola xinjiangensis]
MNDLVERVDAVLRSLLPDAVVTVDGKDTGYGFGSGYTGLVFTLTAASRHVTLGLSHGARLADPGGLLEGAGRVHRHVKLRTVADLDRPELRQLLLDTIELRRAMVEAG